MLAISTRTVISMHIAVICSTSSTGAMILFGVPPVTGYNTKTAPLLFVYHAVLRCLLAAGHTASKCSWLLVYNAREGESAACVKSSS